MDDSFLHGIWVGSVLLLVVILVVSCVQECVVEGPRDALCQKEGYEEHVTWDDSHWCARHTEGTVDSGEIQQYRLVTNETP